MTVQIQKIRNGILQLQMQRSRELAWMRYSSVSEIDGQIAVLQKELDRLLAEEAKPNE